MTFCFCRHIPPRRIISLRHSLQDHSVFQCFSVEAQITTLKLHLSKTDNLVSAGVKVNTCVLTHALCLISEISFRLSFSISSLVVLLSSEDGAQGPECWQEFRRMSSAARGVSVKWCKRLNRCGGAASVHSRRRRRRRACQQRSRWEGFSNNLLFSILFRWRNRGSRSSGSACWATLSTWTSTPSSLRELSRLTATQRHVHWTEWEFNLER